MYGCLSREVSAIKGLISVCVVMREDKGAHYTPIFYRSQDYLPPIYSSTVNLTIQFEDYGDSLII